MCGVCCRQIPVWSFLVWPAFHGLNFVYTTVHSLLVHSAGSALSSEIAPGWWIGGRYAHYLKKKWALTIDLTCEFAEPCKETSLEYLLIRCWDGVPPSPDQIERAALRAAYRTADGDVMVHCAHGRGRSTTVLCACLVRAGHHPTWQQAFEAIRQRRPVVRLNFKMKTALAEWQKRYGTAPLDTGACLPSLKEVAELLEAR